MSYLSVVRVYAGYSKESRVGILDLWRSQTFVLGGAQLSSLPTFSHIPHSLPLSFSPHFLSFPGALSLKSS